MSAFPVMAVVVAAMALLGVGQQHVEFFKTRLGTHAALLQLVELLFQFRQIVADYPTVLSPVFMLQTYMRQKFLGESWWATKRQLFHDAREVVKEQFGSKAKSASALIAALRRLRRARKTPAS